MQSSEAGLINQAILGDRKAFQSLVEKHQSFAYALAYRLTGSAPDAEDMVQESFIRLWKNLHRYRSEVKLTTWLYTIVTHVCFDFLKSAHGNNRRKQVGEENAHATTTADEADRVLQKDELMNAILKIASTLTPKQRVVFTLCDLQGLELKEISQILSVSTGNLKSNLWYARKTVGEQLQLWYGQKIQKL